MGVSVNNGSAFQPSPPSTIPGQILGQSIYNPVSLSTYSSTSGTFADIDAANLAVSFVAPASGIVEVEICAVAVIGANTEVSWGLREAAADVTGSKKAMMYSGASAFQIQCCYKVQITGLTPGSSHTYKASFARTSGASTAGMLVGAAQGQSVMTVRAL